MVNNTESEKKVKIALENIFPNIIFLKKENHILGESVEISALFRLCLLINRQKILDAARNYVLSQIDINNEKKMIDSKFKLYINKQIAYYDKLSFCSENESPLGPIILEINIYSPDLDTFIDEFFPKYEWIM